MPASWLLQLLAPPEVLEGEVEDGERGKEALAPLGRPRHVGRRKHVGPPRPVPFQPLAPHEAMGRGAGQGCGVVHSLKDCGRRRGLLCCRRDCHDGYHKVEHISSHESFLWCLFFFFFFFFLVAFGAAQVLIPVRLVMRGVSRAFLPGLLRPTLGVPRLEALKKKLVSPRLLVKVKVVGEQMLFNQRNAGANRCTAS